MKNRILSIAFISIMSLGAFLCPAQDQIVIKPLFEYPVAPENLVSLEDKSNYLMEHFWDALDVKSKSVSQHALDDAFNVYTTAMRFADRDVVMKSIDNLLKRIRKNPALLTQMTKAAEDNLYGKRADIYSDEAYIPFLKAVVNNKKIPKIRKSRWALQMRQLEASMKGASIPNFSIEERSGAKGVFIPRKKMTIIEFGDPGCSDCRFSRLTMETDTELRKLVEKEQVEIVFIVVNPEDGWENDVKDYPEKWLVASSEGIDDILDIRESPTFYVIDSEGKIVAKNITASQVCRMVVENVSK